MCGRISIACDVRDIAEAFGLDDEAAAAVAPLLGSYNVAPGAALPLVFGDGPSMRRVGPLPWGLRPPWQRDGAGTRPLINARAETVTGKASFAEAFARGRCLLPVAGFYEWRRRGRRRQPWYFSLPAEACFALAAVASPEGFVVVTTEADETMAPVHDRMPLVIAPADFCRWLEVEENSGHDIADLLLHPPAAGLRAWPVSPVVNDARADGAQCSAEVAPGDDPADAPTLF